MITVEEIRFLEMAIEASRKGMQEGMGGPFGCIIVRNGEVIASGCNMVTANNDPTAHAEIMAIREACQKLSTYQLEDCDVYSSCEPCPMCMGAIYWARPRRVIFANTRKEAAEIDFDDDLIYREINTALRDRLIPFIHQPHDKAKEVFRAWQQWEGKKEY